MPPKALAGADGRRRPTRRRPQRCRRCGRSERCAVSSRPSSWGVPTPLWAWARDRRRRSRSRRSGAGRCRRRSLGAAARTARPRRDHRCRPALRLRRWSRGPRRGDQRDHHGAFTFIKPELADGGDDCGRAQADALVHPARIRGFEPDPAHRAGGRGPAGQEQGRRRLRPADDRGRVSAAAHHRIAAAGVARAADHRCTPPAPPRARRARAAPPSTTDPRLAIHGRAGEEGELKRDASLEMGTELQLDAVHPAFAYPAELRSAALEDVTVFVDPLDGTTEFTQGIVSAVTVLIGVAVRGKPFGGVIAQPWFTDERIRCTWGGGGFASLPVADGDGRPTPAAAQALPRWGSSPRARSARMVAARPHCSRRPRGPRLAAALPAARRSRPPRRAPRCSGPTCPPIGTSW